MKTLRCDRCGYRLILYWVGGGSWGKGIPWYACPKCDKKELTTPSPTKEY